MKYIQPIVTHEDLPRKYKSPRKLYNLITESSILSSDTELICNW